MFFQIQIKSEPLFDEAYDDGVVIDGTYSEADNEVSSFFVTLSFVLQQYSSNQISFNPFGIGI